MKHWKVEVWFEAWDAEDAERMLRRMIGPVDAEDRLLFATTPAETNELEAGGPGLRLDPREAPAR